MKIKTLTLLLFITTLTFAQDKKEFSIGETATIKSEILKEDRFLNIALPEGYDALKDEKYPVIYLLDGSANEDFLHVVGLVQFFNLQFNMPKTIIVGIANVDRKRDFTFPTTDKELIEAFPTTGKSEAFINFIEKELQPYINSNYKVSDKKYIIGQSLGGLVASEILIKKPELFTNYIITSPSLWWDNETLLVTAKKEIQKQKNLNLNVYLAVGKEGKVMENDAKSFAKIIETTAKNKIDFHFEYFPNENHATILHNSIYKAFVLEYPYKEPK
jgi:predicted alpha/beta superfamily hydrolase